MKRVILFISLVLFIFSLNTFAIEFQLNGFYGIYTKDHACFKECYGKNKNIFGIGADISFLKFTGLYLDVGYMSASGESSYLKQPLSYNEIQLSAGLKLHLTVFRLSPMKELNLYIKGGGLYIGYSETFEEKISGNVFGFSAGGGLTFWFKRIGIGLEVKKNIASKDLKIKGLDTTETVAYNGLRVVLKCILRF